MLKISNKYFIYTIFTLLLLMEAFLTPTYNWDLDHEMYFGSRLLHGELIWTNEFHDKLPFVPFLFVIPAYFLSVDVFRVIVLIFILFTALSLNEFFNKIYTENKNISLFCSVLFMVLLYFSHNSFATINCLAVCFFTMFSICIFSEKIFPVLGLEKPRYLLLFGSFWASMAISIRPYYLLPAACMLMCVQFFFNKNNITKTRIFFQIAEWGLVIALFGGLFNVTPYLVTGQMSAFFDGLHMLASPINPESGPLSFIRMAKKPSDIFLWISWLLMVFIIGYGIIKNKKIVKYFSIEMFIVSFFSSGLLLFSILEQHYWDHYIQLFIGGFCICLNSFLVFLSSEESFFSFKTSNKISVELNKIVIFLLCCGILFFSADSVRRIFFKKDKDYSKNGEVQTLRTDWKKDIFLKYLSEKYPEKKPSFLFPEDMKMHWLLGESRYHFPHTSNTWHIFLGWWKNIHFRSSHFYIVSDANEYCSLINKMGPQIIAITPKGFVMSCFISGKESRYKIDTVLTHDGNTLLVYKRILLP